MSEPPNTRTLEIERYSGERLRTDEGSRCNYSEVQEKSPRDVKPRKKARGKHRKKGGSTHSFLASPKTSRSRSRHSISKDTSCTKLQENLSPLLSEAQSPPQSYRIHAKNASMPKEDVKDQHDPTGSTSNISSKSRMSGKSFRQWQPSDFTLEEIHELETLSDIRKKVNVSPKETSREKSPPKAAPCPSKEKVCLPCPPVEKTVEEVVKAKTPTSPPREGRKSPRQSSGERRSAEKKETSPKCNILCDTATKKDLSCRSVEQRSDLSMSTAKGKKSPVSRGKEKNKGKKKETSPKAPGACIPGYRFRKRCARRPSLNRQNFFGNLAQAVGKELNSLAYRNSLFHSFPGMVGLYRPDIGMDSLFVNPSSVEPSETEEELDGVERESKWSSNKKRKDDDDTSRQVSSEEKLLSEKEPKMRSISVQATPSSKKDSGISKKSGKQAKAQVAEAATETTPYMSSLNSPPSSDESVTVKDEMTETTRRQRSSVQPRLSRRQTGESYEAQGYFVRDQTSDTKENRSEGTIYKSRAAVLKPSQSDSRPLNSSFDTSYPIPEARRTTMKSMYDDSRMSAQQDELIFTTPKMEKYSVYEDTLPRFGQRHLDVSKDDVAAPISRVDKRVYGSVNYQDEPVKKEDIQTLGKDEAAAPISRVDKRVYGSVNYQEEPVKKEDIPIPTMVQNEVPSLKEDNKGLTAALGSLNPEDDACLKVAPESLPDCQRESVVPECAYPFQEKELSISICLEPDLELKLKQKDERFCRKSISAKQSPIRCEETMRSSRDKDATKECEDKQHDRRSSNMDSYRSQRSNDSHRPASRLEPFTKDASSRLRIDIKSCQRDPVACQEDEVSTCSSRETSTWKQSLSDALKHTKPIPCSDRRSAKEDSCSEKTPTIDDQPSLVSCDSEKQTDISIVENECAFASDLDATEDDISVSIRSRGSKRYSKVSSKKISGDEHDNKRHSGKRNYTSDDDRYIPIHIKERGDNDTCEESDHYSSSSDDGTYQSASRIEYDSGANVAAGDTYPQAQLRKIRGRITIRGSEKTATSLRNAAMVAQKRASSPKVSKNYDTGDSCSTDNSDYLEKARELTLSNTKHRRSNSISSTNDKIARYVREKEHIRERQLRALEYEQNLTQSCDPGSYMSLIGGHWSPVPAPRGSRKDHNSIGKASDTSESVSYEYRGYSTHKASVRSRSNLARYEAKSDQYRAKIIDSFKQVITPEQPTAMNDQRASRSKCDYITQNLRSPDSPYQKPRDRLVFKTTKEIESQDYTHSCSSKNGAQRVPVATDYNRNKNFPHSKPNDSAQRRRNPYLLVKNEFIPCEEEDEREADALERTRKCHRKSLDTRRYNEEFDADNEKSVQSSSSASSIVYRHDTNISQGCFIPETDATEYLFSSPDTTTLLTIAKNKNCSSNTERDRNSSSGGGDFLYSDFAYHCGVIDTLRLLDFDNVSSTPSAKVSMVDVVDDVSDVPRKVSLCDLFKEENLAELARSIQSLGADSQEDEAIELVRQNSIRALLFAASMSNSWTPFCIFPSTCSKDTAKWVQQQKDHITQEVKSPIECEYCISSSSQICIRDDYSKEGDAKSDETCNSSIINDTDIKNLGEQNEAVPKANKQSVEKWAAHKITVSAKENGVKNSVVAPNVNAHVLKEDSAVECRKQTTSTIVECGSNTEFQQASRKSVTRGVQIQVECTRNAAIQTVNNKEKVKKCDKSENTEVQYFVRDVQLNTRASRQSHKSRRKNSDTRTNQSAPSSKKVNSSKLCKPSTRDHRSYQAIKSDTGIDDVYKLISDMPKSKQICLDQKKEFQRVDSSPRKIVKLNRDRSLSLESLQKDPSASALRRRKRFNSHSIEREMRSQSHPIEDPDSRMIKSNHSNRSNKYVIAHHSMSSCLVCSEECSPAVEIRSCSKHHKNKFNKSWYEDYKPPCSTRVSSGVSSGKCNEMKQVYYFERPKSVCSCQRCKKRRSAFKNYIRQRRKCDEGKKEIIVCKSKRSAGACGDISTNNKTENNCKRCLSEDSTLLDSVTVFVVASHSSLSGEEDEFLYATNENYSLQKKVIKKALEKARCVSSNSLENVHVFTITDSDELVSASPTIEDLGQFTSWTCENKTLEDRSQLGRQKKANESSPRDGDIAKFSSSSSILPSKTKTDTSHQKVKVVNRQNKTRDEKKSQKISKQKFLSPKRLRDKNESVVRDNKSNSSKMDSKCDNIDSGDSSSNSDDFGTETLEKTSREPEVPDHSSKQRLNRCRDILRNELLDGDSHKTEKPLSHGAGSSISSRSTSKWTDTCMDFTELQASTGVFNSSRASLTKVDSFLCRPNTETDKAHGPSSYKCDKNTQGNVQEGINSSVDPPEAKKSALRFIQSIIDGQVKVLLDKAIQSWTSPVIKKTPMFNVQSSSVDLPEICKPLSSHFSQSEVTSPSLSLSPLKRSAQCIPKAEEEASRFCDRESLNVFNAGLQKCDDSMKCSQRKSLADDVATLSLQQRKSLADDIATQSLHQRKSLADDVATQSLHQRKSLADDVATLSLQQRKSLTGDVSTLPLQWEKKKNCATIGDFDTLLNKESFVVENVMPKSKSACSSQTVSKSDFSNYTYMSISDMDVAPPTKDHNSSKTNTSSIDTRSKHLSRSTKKSKRASSHKSKRRRKSESHQEQRTLSRCPSKSPSRSSERKHFNVKSPTPDSNPRRSKSAPKSNLPKRKEGKQKITESKNEMAENSFPTEAPNEDRKTPKGKSFSECGVSRIANKLITDSRNEIFSYGVTSSSSEDIKQKILMGCRHFGNEVKDRTVMEEFIERKLCDQQLNEDASISMDADSLAGCDAIESCMLTPIMEESQTANDKSSNDFNSFVSECKEKMKDIMSKSKSSANDTLSSSTSRFVSSGPPKIQENASHPKENIDMEICYEVKPSSKENGTCCSQSNHDNTCHALIEGYKTLQKKDTPIQLKGPFKSAFLRNEMSYVSAGLDSFDPFLKENQLINQYSVKKFYSRQHTPRDWLGERIHGDLNFSKSKYADHPDSCRNFTCNVSATYPSAINYRFSLTESHYKSYLRSSPRNYNDMPVSSHLRGCHHSVFSSATADYSMDRTQWPLNDTPRGNWNYTDIAKRNRNESANNGSDSSSSESSGVDEVLNADEGDKYSSVANRAGMYYSDKSLSEKHPKEARTSKDTKQIARKVCYDSTCCQCHDPNSNTYDMFKANVPNNLVSTLACRNINGSGNMFGRATEENRASHHVGLGEQHGDSDEDYTSASEDMLNYNSINVRNKFIRNDGQEIDDTCNHPDTIGYYANNGQSSQLDVFNGAPKEDLLVNMFSADESHPAVISSYRQKADLSERNGADKKQGCSDIQGGNGHGQQLYKDTYGAGSRSCFGQGDTSNKKAFTQWYVDDVEKNIAGQRRMPASTESGKYPNRDNRCEETKKDECHDVGGDNDDIDDDEGDEYDEEEEVCADEEDEDEAGEDDEDDVEDDDDVASDDSNLELTHVIGDAPNIDCRKKEDNHDLGDSRHYKGESKNITDTLEQRAAQNKSYNQSKYKCFDSKTGRINAKNHRHGHRYSSSSRGKHSSGYPKFSLDQIKVPTIEKERVRFACDENGDWAEIGRGSYGCVYLGLLDGIIEVAIKDFYESSSWDLVIHEARMLMFLQDTGITPKFYGLRRRFDVSKQPSEYCIIMEYFGDGRTLFNVMSDKIALTRDSWLDIVGQLVAGLRLIHRKNILINDLKADNILIDLTGGNNVEIFIDSIRLAI
uniref:Protein kinase domain-containing protein n=1 Tax=Biomphalaria glabrata TaxID=6526 RepID=A0A2C9L5F8_BIOGL